MANEKNTVITLICERAADVNDMIDSEGRVTSVDGLHVVKLPCSGMIQPLMIEAAMKAGASGVIVCGCQIGDCYFREGNKMIRERLLGERPPGLKKTVDRRRVLALWLSRVQKERFLSEAKEFMNFISSLPAPEPAAKPAAPAVQQKEAAKAAPASASKTNLDAVKKETVSVDGQKTDAFSTPSTAEVAQQKEAAATADKVENASNTTSEPAAVVKTDNASTTSNVAKDAGDIPQAPDEAGAKNVDG